jgi:hypothetical protein
MPMFLQLVQKILVPKFVFNECINEIEPLCPDQVVLYEKASLPFRIIILKIYVINCFVKRFQLAVFVLLIKCHLFTFK